MESSISVVLYPCLGMGHLISMVELGKFILRHHPSFSIAILTLPPSFHADSISDYIRRISATVPSITFHSLPAVNPSPNLDSFPSVEAFVFEVVRLSHPHVRRALEAISRSSTVSAFIIDFFCTTAQATATQLRIPTYYFITSGAHFTAILFHLTQLHRATTESFKDMNKLLYVPGVPPLPSSDMVKPLLDRTTTDYQNFLDISNNMRNAAGVIINTFERLEPTPLAALREGKCGPTPPVYCVGPLLAASDKIVGDCMKWLDKQPSKSVVYICFGSIGLVSASQLREIAEGLERSGCRFLWVVRSPPQEAEEKSKWFVSPPEPDVDVLLPAGFMERTEERGMVVKSWAPQVAVLKHAAVGGFVTHCGWNSVLEAVCAGVPMVTWPLYAEQHVNRVALVEEMKVALRLEMGKDGSVAAEEVERRVVELMVEESVKGKEIREVVEEMSVEARAAMAEGGSSMAALANLAELWKSDKLARSSPICSSSGTHNNPK